MKLALRILKYLVLGVIGIVGVAAATIGIIWWHGPSHRDVTDVKFPRTPERLARGEVLAKEYCLDCHGQVQVDVWSKPTKPGTEGKGGCAPYKEGDFGHICTPNITSDPKYGVGAWTDDELARVIREGIDRNGRPILPYHTTLHRLADEDVQAIVAYLRTIPPSDHLVPRSEVDFPSRFLSIMVFSQDGYRPITHPVTRPDPKTDPVGYGKYLVELNDCEMCHSPRDGFTPKKGMEFAGGQVFDGHIRSANLTPDPTGLGPMTKESFIALFNVYRNPAAASVRVKPADNTAMPWVGLSKLSDEDLGAIYDYLRTVKPIHNVVQKFVTPPQPHS